MANGAVNDSVPNPIPVHISSNSLRAVMDYILKGKAKDIVSERWGEDTEAWFELVEFADRFDKPTLTEALPSRKTSYLGKGLAAEVFILASKHNKVETARRALESGGDEMRKDAAKWIKAAEPHYTAELFRLLASHNYFPGPFDYKSVGWSDVARHFSPEKIIEK